MITVFTKSSCPACVSTKNFLDAMGLDYEVKNIEEDDSNFQEVLDLGFKQVPVVVVDDDSWSGHNTAKLIKLK